jgi:transposase InsO family protein
VAVLIARNVMEQRYEAVMAVLRDGEPVTEVAVRFGVSRQSVHAWMRRYQDGGITALVDGSHRPASCPHQMPAEIEAEVCELRRQHPGWGPTRLAAVLARRGVAPAPSRSAVYRALVRQRLIETGRRRQRKDWLRWERHRPMELWQLDVVGGIMLADGTELKALTGVDDYSRFCVSAGLVERANARAVCGVFVDAMRIHGVPEEVLTDNGKVFTGRHSSTPSEVLFDRICRQNGIAHRLTGVRAPTTTGKIERFHRTLREEFLASAALTSLGQAQSALDAWVGEYNKVRPHQAIGLLTPAERFAQRVEAPVVDLEEPRDDPSSTVTRKVARNGVISVSHQVFSVGAALAGKQVTVHIDDDLLHVWCEGARIRTVLRTSRGEVRKKRARRD